MNTVFQITHHNVHGTQRITGVQKGSKLLLITNGVANEPESNQEIAGILLDVVLVQDLVHNLQNFINLNT
jgi:hypothetical protein